MGLKEIEGKKVYFKLISGRIYTGTVQSVIFIGLGKSDSQRYMIEIIDKFGKIVCFTSNEIELMEERE